MQMRSAALTRFQFMIRSLTVLSCLTAMLLVSCDSVTECDCEDEINRLTNQRGTPSNFDITESADYNRHEYVYLNADGSQDTYVFEWGDEDPDGNTINVCCRQTVTRTSEEGEETDITDGDANDDENNGDGAPVANSDSVSTTAGTSRTFSVKSNDTDPDGDALTVSSVTQPANGSTNLESNQDITYTPDSGFIGTDTFTYRVCDPGDLCDTGTVTITVT
ncbi:MAG: Ig-like domain-containing protein [Desulfobacterales bacterium]